MSINQPTNYEVEVHEEVVQQGGPMGIDRRERVEVVRDGGLEQRETIVEDRGAARSFAFFQLTNLVWLLVAILELLLLLRLGLKLMAANAAAPFVTLVYGVTDLFLWPFFGMVGNPSAANGMIMEITTVFAMFVYLILGWIAVKIIQMLTSPNPLDTSKVRIERRERL